MNKIECPMCGTKNEQIYAYANGDLYQICDYCECKYEIKAVTSYKVVDVISKKEYDED